MTTIGATWTEAGALDPRTTLYARGFFLTAGSSAPDAISHWSRQALGEWTLYHDQRCSLGLAQDEGSWFALLGVVIGIEPLCDDVQRLARDGLTALGESDHAFLLYLANLSGRFIAIYPRGEGIALQQDAGGLRSVFFAPGSRPAVVASHATLLAAYLGYPRGEISTYDQGYLPGLKTPWEGIYPLVPNHQLMLPELRMTRVHPRDSIPERNVTSVADEVSELMIGQLRMMAESRPLLLSLTAGLDSRTVLALVRDFADRITIFTYYLDHRSEWARRVLETDIRVASDIAWNLRLEHTHVIPEPEGIGPAAERLFKENSYLGHLPAVAVEYARRLPGNGIHIRSNLAELGQAFYRRSRQRDLPLTPERMAEAFAWRQGHDTAAREAFEEFAEMTRFGDFDGFDPYDLFYWEHRMGTWLTHVLNESDIAFDTFIPFGSRRVLDAILSVPLQDRLDCTLFHELIRRNWPVLLAWPVNPKSGWALRTLPPQPSPGSRDPVSRR